MKKKAVLENIFSNIFSGKYFLGHIFSKKMSKNPFPENGVGGNFGFGGRARKITPLVYPLIFKNFFGHETGRRGSCGAVQVLVLQEISSRGPF